MNRKLVWGFIGIIGLSVILAVTVAVVGSKLDGVQLERDDLEVDVEELRDEVATLGSERDALRTEQMTRNSQVDEQLRTIEQLKAELERTRAQAQSSTQPTEPAAP